MSERYQKYGPSVPGRSATYNPARSSMPTSIGYSSMYAGDMHVVPSASHQRYVTPRGYTSSSNSSSKPPTVSTYKVDREPRADAKTHATRNRRSTLDSVSRKPVVIMTTQEDPSRATSISRPSNGGSRSPVKDDYRASDGQVYSQPASSIRSRGLAKHYRHHAISSSEDRGQYRERADRRLSPRRNLQDYRSSRPSVVYPSNPRHSKVIIDYGDEGYQYTNVGELVKYDLDHSIPGRSSRYQDNPDAGYYRSNVKYDTDRRNVNAIASHDLSRDSARQSEARGPPPSTRGFDKVNRLQDPRDVPPSAPAPPPPTSTGSQLEVSSAVGTRRPLSLHQDGAASSPHHDEYYRSRESERAMRELRDRDRDRDSDLRVNERRHEPPRYLDEGVTSRGFGIRTDLLDSPTEVRELRRDAWSLEPRERSDEDLRYGSDKDKENRHRSHQVTGGDYKDGKLEARIAGRDGRDQQDRSRSRPSLATGLATAAVAAAAATEFAPTLSKGQSRSSHEPRGERDIWKDGVKIPEPRQSVSKVRETAYRDARLPLEREREASEGREPLLIREKNSALDKDEHLFRGRQTGKDKELIHQLESYGEAAKGMTGSDEQRSAIDYRAKSDNVRPSESDSDDTRRSARRARHSAAFDPNDASDLKQLKEQLASLDVSSQPRERQSERPAVTEAPRVRSSSPTKPGAAASSSQDSAPESRALRDREQGQDVVAAASDGKQVRLVSPPREKGDGKPLKGILKQPKVSFPEEDNPIREGVAPHKEDKKLKEVPPGARWTKINRKIVNPEALTVGRERFEVRDDFVIVLRVLSSEEIQAYASATQVLRERRRARNNENHDRERGRGRDRDGINDDDATEEDERDHRRRRRRDGDRDDAEEQERGRDGERDYDDAALRDADQRHQQTSRSHRRE